MKQSQLLYSTSAQASKDSESTNAKYLVQGGFIKPLFAGVQSYLPLGLRVLKKIENIVREEMNNIDAQEVLMPALHPYENYQKTNRTDIDILYHLQSRGDRKLLLGISHEEVVTPLVKDKINSYKDLPLGAYQIQTKFRDELRAKSGILRGREFLMKDLYSFNASLETHEEYYNNVKEAYKKIFKRLNLEALITEASGGSFSKEHSHEFQVITPAGEDLTVHCSKCDFAENKEISQLDKDQPCPKCQEKLSVDKSVEAGNIFSLGDKFAKDFGLKYADKDGSQKNVIMGCYGIGISRALGAIVEVHHDDKGIIWPKVVAPYQIHLIALGKEEIVKKTEEVYNTLSAEGIEVLFDDRDISAGKKFTDSDLIGIPVRIVISDRTLKENSAEIKLRDQEEAELIKLDEIPNKI